METVRDGDLEIVMAGPTGYGNNVYVVIDRATNEAAFIDAPGEPDVNAAAAEVQVCASTNACAPLPPETSTACPSVTSSASQASMSAFGRCTVRTSSSALVDAPASQGGKASEKKALRSMPMARRPRRRTSAVRWRRSRTARRRSAPAHRPARGTSRRRTRRAPCRSC